MGQVKFWRLDTGEARALPQGHAPKEVRKVVFLTGGAVTLKDDDFLRSVPNPLVKKPFEAPALSKYVQEFLRIEPGQSKSSTARP